MTKNKIKLGLVALGVIAIMGLSVSAALAANLTYNSDTNINITDPGYTLTIKSGSELTSLVVNTTNIVIVVPTSSTFTMESRNDITVSASGGTDASSTSCSGTTNTLVIPGDSAITYTLTPNGGVCAESAGGGGDNYTYAATPAAATPAATSTTTTTTTTTTTPAETTTPTTTTTTTTTAFPTLKALPHPSATTVPELQANLNVLLENLAALQAYQKTLVATTTPSAAIPASGSFTTHLYIGTSNSEVTALQEFLKAQGTDIYPEGLVTGYFGSLTEAAVGRFQIQNGIVANAADAGYGHVGPKTRAEINSLLGL